MASTVIYCRVSSKKQLTRGVSLAAQLTYCQKMLPLSTAHTIVQEVSSVYQGDPPLLSALIKKRNQTVLMYSVDRLARKTKLGLNLAIQSIVNKSTLIFAREQLTINRASGTEWDKFKAALVQAETESRILSERVRSSLTHLKQSGKRSKLEESTMPGAPVTVYKRLTHGIRSPCGSSPSSRSPPSSLATLHHVESPPLLSLPAPMEICEEPVFNMGIRSDSLRSK